MLAFARAAAVCASTGVLCVTRPCASATRESAIRRCSRVVELCGRVVERGLRDIAPAARARSRRVIASCPSGSWRGRLGIGTRQIGARARDGCLRSGSDRRHRVRTRWH
jgi:hypothetical protein